MEEEGGGTKRARDPDTTIEEPAIKVGRFPVLRLRTAVISEPHELSDEPRVRTFDVVLHEPPNTRIIFYQSGVEDVASIGLPWVDTFFWCAPAQYLNETLLRPHRGEIIVDKAGVDVTGNTRGQPGVIPSRGPSLRYVEQTLTQLYEEVLAHVKPGETFVVALACEVGRERSLAKFLLFHMALLTMQNPDTLRRGTDYLAQIERWWRAETNASIAGFPLTLPSQLDTMRIVVRRLGPDPRFANCAACGRTLLENVINSSACYVFETRLFYCSIKCH
jgi:hypothetical protein